MEKEFQIQSSNLELNYVGDDFEGLQNSLNSLAKVFAEFLELDLNQIESSCFVNISLCSSDKIIELNSQYRNKERITDVLSFPVQENIRHGDVDSFSPELELGDIFICKSVCESQAKEFGIDFREEFIHLTVHGLLHLCGYDHELGPEEEALMESLESKLLLSITKVK